MLEQNSDDVALEMLLAETEIVSGYTPEKLEELLFKLCLLDDLTMTAEQFDETVNGVNVNRLLNHPVAFTDGDIKNIYKSFIKVIQ